MPGSVPVPVPVPFVVARPEGMRLPVPVEMGYDFTVPLLGKGYGFPVPFDV